MNLCTARSDIRVMEVIRMWPTRCSEMDPGMLGWREQAEKPVGETRLAVATAP